MPLTELKAPVLMTKPLIVLVLVGPEITPVTPKVPLIRVLPATSTLNLLVPLFCKSIRLPVGVVVLLLARIKAWPATGSLVPLCKTLKAELVPLLVRLRTPAPAPVLVLVRPSRIPATEADEVSVAFLAM